MMHPSKTLLAAGITALLAFPLVGLAKNNGRFSGLSPNHPRYQHVDWNEENDDDDRPGRAAQAQANKSKMSRSSQVALSRSSRSLGTLEICRLQRRDFHIMFREEHKAWHRAHRVNDDPSAHRQWHKDMILKHKELFRRIRSGNCVLSSASSSQSSVSSGQATSSGSSLSSQSSLSSSGSLSSTSSLSSGTSVSSISTSSQSSL